MHNFISCDGDVLPCCWWGNNQFATKYDPNHVGHKDKHVQILKNMKIDLRKYDWDEIINEYKKQRDYNKFLHYYFTSFLIKPSCATEATIVPSFLKILPLAKPLEFDALGLSIS